MRFINEKLAELEDAQSALDRMPCGDERAEKVRLIDRARKEIMTLEAHVMRGRAVVRIEERVEEVFEQLNLNTEQYEY